jgi:hypothetical protein
MSTRIENPLNRGEIFKAEYNEKFKPVDKKCACLAVEIFTEIKNFFYQWMHETIGLIVLPAAWLKKSVTTGPKTDLFTSGQEVSFKTADGVTLNGMHFIAENNQANDRTVILFNGNGVYYEEYKSGRIFNIKKCEDQKYNVLVFNYRGVGKSNGKP